MKHTLSKAAIYIATMTFLHIPNITCAENIPKLIVISGSSNETLLEPHVSIPDDPDCCSLTRDNSDTRRNRWIMSLISNPNRLVTSYTISPASPHHTNVVGIRVDFPSSIETQDQSVWLSPPTVSDATDRTVFRYWSGEYALVLLRNAQIKDLLNALQNLHYIVSEQQRESASTSDPSPRRARAAYMLLNTVQKLGGMTWYIVADDYQDSVDYASKILTKTAHHKRCEDWLGRESCKDTQDLDNGIVGRQNKLEGARLGRLYGLIIPDQTKLTSVDACTKNRIHDLKKYYEYFKERTSDNATAPDIRRGSGVSEIRVAADYAACVDTIVRCSMPSNSTDLLESAITMLNEAKSRYRQDHDIVDKRSNAISTLQEDFIAGIPMNCKK